MERQVRERGGSGKDALFQHSLLLSLHRKHQHVMSLRLHVIIRSNTVRQWSVIVITATQWGHNLFPLWFAVIIYTHSSVSPITHSYMMLILLCYCFSVRTTDNTTRGNWLHLPFVIDKKKWFAVAVCKKSTQRMFEYSPKQQYRSKQIILKLWCMYRFTHALSIFWCFFYLLFEDIQLKLFLIDNNDNMKVTNISK